MLSLCKRFGKFHIAAGGDTGGDTRGPALFEGGSRFDDFIHQGS